MLAIVEAFQEWRPYFSGTTYEVQVYINHKICYISPRLRLSTKGKHDKPSFFHSSISASITGNERRIRELMLEAAGRINRNMELKHRRRCFNNRTMKHYDTYFNRLKIAVRSSGKNGKDMRLGATQHGRTSQVGSRRTTTRRRVKRRNIFGRRL